MLGKEATIKTTDLKTQDINHNDFLKTKKTRKVLSVLISGVWLLSQDYTSESLL